jgi:hypothetical protein
MSKRERPSTQLEIFIGRSLAMCVHPFAAWRTQSNSQRGFIVLAYFAASYVLALVVLASGLGV